MSGSPSERLVGELVRELRPVRPIPPLRAVLAGVLGVFALGLAADAVVAGWTPRVGADSYWAEPVFLGVFAGLVVTALSALVAGLAGGVPGREALARRSAQLALIGAVATLGAGLAPLIRAAAASPGSSLGQHLTCAGHACALGLAPALAACFFLARAATPRPLWAAGAAALGAVALGGVAVHASCSAGGLHWLLGHALFPSVLAAALALPLAALVSRSVRSGS